MRGIGLKLKLTAIAAFFTCGLTAQNNESKFITINGAKTAYSTFNTGNRKEGEPVIVFEAGFGSGGGSFGPVSPLLPQNLPWIAYDRNGIGESEIDRSIETHAGTVERLHTLLSTLEIRPPYLLVGHSLGGPLIRLYAAAYPDEVCGLFFIDPTDFMLTENENEQVKIKTGSKTGYIEITRANFNYMLSDESSSPGLSAEINTGLSEVAPVFFGNYSSLPPLKDIPVTVLIAYNKHIEPYEQQMNDELQLGITDMIPWWKEFDMLRIEHYACMIKYNQNSSVILLPGLSHGIHHQNPRLVADALINAYDNCLKSLKK